nr:unnamed protein product [Digitaria exilis]
MSPAKKLARADRIIREMGLSAVANSRIGGRVSKGISGGERRRVSICMELLASPGLLFLDEPTSGLDSAAAYHVMAYIARLARTMGITVVAAIHQPSTEVFDLFNGLYLLANGRMVYFGPIALAAEGMLLLSCGFFRLPHDLPKLVWKYPMYFISYHKYGIQGLYKNEFLSLAVEDQQNRNGLVMKGGNILKNILQVEMGYSKWVDLAVLCIMAIFYRAMFLAALKLTEIWGPIIKLRRMKV